MIDVDSPPSSTLKLPTPAPKTPPSGTRKRTRDETETDDTKPPLTTLQLLHTTQQLRAQIDNLRRIITKLETDVSLQTTLAFTLRNETHVMDATT